MGMRDGGESVAARSDPVHLRVLLQFGGGGARYVLSINVRRIVPSFAHSVRHDGVTEFSCGRARRSYSLRSG